MPPKAINFQRFKGLETLFGLDDLKDPRALNDLRSGCAGAETEREVAGFCDLCPRVTKLLT